MIQNKSQNIQTSISINEPLNQNDNSVIQRRRPQRKLSQIHQRVTQNSTEMRGSQKEQKRKDTHSKTKVDRRDTRQTQLAVSQVSVKIQQSFEDRKINQLIQKAQNDPFLRRKLKNMMQNDLKSLKRMNSKNELTLNQYNNNSILGGMLSKKGSNLNTTQLLENEYKKIPKDISMDLNNSVLTKRNISMNDSGISKIPINTRLFGGCTEEQSMIKFKNTSTQKNQFTTLRKQSYRTKVNRLQVLKDVEEKEKSITKFAMQKFGQKSIQDNICRIPKPPTYKK